eukprot:gene7979-biopygen6094
MAVRDSRGCLLQTRVFRMGGAGTPHNVLAPQAPKKEVDRRIQSDLEKCVPRFDTPGGCPASDGAEGTMWT